MTDTKETIAETLDVIALVAGASVAPVAGASPVAAAGVGMLSGLAEIAARLLREGVADPVAHITRALDIASRVKAQEDAGAEALHERFAGHPDVSAPRPVNETPLTLPHQGLPK